MAKKNFKGGLDSLIEKSLGMKKSGLKKGNFKGNPIDLVPSDETTEQDNSAAQEPKAENASAPAEKPAKDISASTKTETPEAQQPEATAAPETKPDEPIKVTSETAPEETVPENTSEISKPEETVSTIPQEDDSANIAYLKSIIHDLRQELSLWRNGKIDVQIFNQTLHQHNLKYNPETNEIEEI